MHRSSSKPTLSVPVSHASSREKIVSRQKQGTDAGDASREPSHQRSNHTHHMNWRKLTKRMRRKIESQGLGCGGHLLRRLLLLPIRRLARSRTLRQRPSNAARVVWHRWCVSFLCESLLGPELNDWLCSAMLQLPHNCYTPLAQGR